MGLGRGQCPPVGREGQEEQGGRRHGLLPSRPARGEILEDDRPIAPARQGQDPAIGGER